MPIGATLAYVVIERVTARQLLPSLRSIRPVMPAGLTG
jgi:hypothetical protein